MSNLKPPTRPLLDSFGRVHNNLRISVTDRCNIRCFYCMPAEGVQFLPRTELLTFEEIVRFVRVMARLGIDRIRLTGGEPLVRSELDRLIRYLVEVDGIVDLALTTNAILLADQAERLKQAGLHRLNISIDSLDEATFQKITRRKGLDQVIAGIDKAIEVGFKKIRLNAVSIAGLSEPELVPLARFAAERDLELRFIEFMPLDAEQGWSADQILSGKKVREILEKEFGQLEPADRTDPSQPATDFVFRKTGKRVGFINPVSEPFCGDCNRLRITAEGKIRNCLFSTTEWDLRGLIRSGGTDREIESLVRDCIEKKKAAHGISDDDFQRPEKAMFQIGG